MKNKDNIKFLAAIIAAFFGLSCPLMAQEKEEKPLRPTFSLEYVGEIQSDFKKVKFVNHLHLRANLPLTKKLSVELASVSAASTDENPLVDDMQGYSNIDADNTPFALAVAGMSWRINERHWLFGGVRRMDEDYFCSDMLALFTNSTCGGFPTITANYDIAAYPKASVGVHYEYNGENVGVKASVYNGMGHNRFNGNGNVFRFCPKSDGVFALAQAEYRRGDSRYYLGGSVHYSDLCETAQRRARPVVWTYAEQSITDKLMLFAGYSHAFSGDNACRNFCAVGGKYSLGKAELGIFSNYTRIDGTDEWATELTCQIQCNKAVFVQPVLHVIDTDGKTNCVGMMRIGVCL